MNVPWQVAPQVPLPVSASTFSRLVFSSPSLAPIAASGGSPSFWQMMRRLTKTPRRIVSGCVSVPFHARKPSAGQEAGALGRGRAPPRRSHRRRRGAQRARRDAVDARRARGRRRWCVEVSSSDAPPFCGRTRCARRTARALRACRRRRRVEVGVCGRALCRGPIVLVGLVELIEEGDETSPWRAGRASIRSTFVLEAGDRVELAACGGRRRASGSGIVPQSAYDRRDAISYGLELDEAVARRRVVASSGR